MQRGRRPARRLINVPSHERLRIHSRTRNGKRTDIKRAERLGDGGFSGGGCAGGGTMNRSSFVSASAVASRGLQFAVSPADTLIPGDIREKYDVVETRHAAAILV